MLSTIGSPLPRRAWARASATFFAIFTLSVGAARAQDFGMTFDMALQIAMSRSSGIQATQALVRGTSDVVVSAGQLPNPTLNVSLQDLPINGRQALTIGQDNFTMRGIGIQQEWVSADKRRLRTALAERAVDRDQASSLQKVAEVRQQTAMAWLNAIYAKQAVALNQALIDHLGDEVSARQASYRGAKGAAVDVAQANLALANARDELILAKQDEQTALIDLSRWTAAGNVLNIAGEPPKLDTPVPSLSVEQLAETQPALIAARSAISLADADTNATRSNRTPNWTWGLTYFKSGGNYPDYVSVGVSIPLPIHRGAVEDRATAQKSEAGTEARLMYEDTQRKVLADIQNLAAKLASSKARLTNAEANVLPAASQKVALANAAYRSGAGSLADALDARHTQLEADLQVLKLKRDASLVWAQLEYQVLPIDVIHSQ